MKENMFTTVQHDNLRKQPLSDKINTPQPHRQPSPSISHFEQADIKNQLILTIIPRDPHLNSLAQTLERQAREYQQKQLIESFPLRYNDLLRKQERLEISQRQLKQETARSESLVQQLTQLQQLIEQKEIEWQEREAKMQSVVEQSQLQKQRAILSIKTEFEGQLTLLRSEIENMDMELSVQRQISSKLRLDIKELSSELEDKIVKQKQRQCLLAERQALIVELQEQLKESKQFLRTKIANYADQIEQVTQNNQDLQQQLLRATQQLRSDKQKISQLSVDKGVHMQRIDRCEQERLEFKMLYERVTLELRQQQTITSEIGLEIQTYKNIELTKNQEIQNQLFEIAKLTGQITLKEVELGDKIADIITLKEKVNDLLAEIQNIKDVNRHLKAEFSSHINQNQQSSKYKMTSLQESLNRQVEETNFLKKQNSYLLAIRQELEAENNKLKLRLIVPSQILSSYESLQQSFQVVITKTQKQYEQLKKEVVQASRTNQLEKLILKQEKDELSTVVKELQQKVVSLREEVEKYLKMLSEKEREHDKVVEKLIEVSKSHAKTEKSVELLKKTDDCSSLLAEKDQQIKSLQNLLRETRNTILGLSESLKQRTSREKELFDEVLAEKRKMKKYIEDLEGELKTLKK